MTGPSPPPSDCPYMGLSFYGEGDAGVFFGREAERRIIIANLRASRLTLLYAQSGVGKSSLIRAGVAARLRALAKESHAERGSPRHIPVVFSSWRDDPVEDLIAESEAAISPFVRQGPPPRLPRDDLPAALETATRATGATLLIILDQFEEYFLYRSREAQPGRLAESVAACIARGDLRANFLVVVREDAYAGVGDVFKGRIQNVYGNFLHLSYLDRDAARAAIEKPLDWFKNHHPGQEPHAVDPGLVDEVLDEVRTGQVLLEQAGHGTVAATNGHAGGHEQIETPYLQLVMTTLWERERAAGSDRLRLATLRELGGAQEIVRRHLDNALAGLTDDERETAVSVFHHLVTPSGTKIVHTIPDLVEYSGRSAEQVTGLIEKLASGDQRILRPVPPDADGNPRVEIFHDVLAPAILAWRTQQTAQQLKREKHAAEVRARRSLAVAVGATVLLLVAVAGVVFAEISRSQARAAQKQSESAVLAGEGFRNLAFGDLAPGVLLSMEAYRASPSPAARGNLVSAQVLTLGMTGYLRAQSGPVNRVAFDPVAPLLASASVDGTVVLWNLRTGHQRLVSSGTEPIDSVAFSRDGRYLAAADTGGTVTVSDLATGRSRHLAGGAGAVSDVAFAPAGDDLAAANADGSAVVWSGSTGRRLRVLAGRAGALNGLAFSPSGRTLAAAAAGGSVLFWDMATGRLRQVVVKRGSSLNGIAFDPNGRSVAVAVQSGEACLVPAVTAGAPGCVSEGHAPVEAVAFSPDGRTFASAGAATLVWLWDAHTGQLVRTFQGQAATVETVAFSPDGRLIASGSDDQSVYLWETALASGRRTLQDGHGGALALAYGGPTLATANTDGTVTVWNLAGASHRSAAAGDGTLWSIALSRNGRELATAGTGGQVLVWSLPGLADPRRLTDRGSTYLQSVALSQDGRMVAAGDGSGDILVWNTGRSTPIHVFHGRAGTVNSLAFSAGDAELASGDADGTVILWDLRSGRRLLTLTGHTGQVNGVAFNPTGTLVAAAGADQTIIIWHARTGQPVGNPLRGHEASVNTVAFSPDGRSLASGGADHAVIVWNLASRLGWVLAGHADNVTGVAYGPDATLASADQSGRVLLYGSPPPAGAAAAIAHRLCAVIGRNLTPQEWTEFVPSASYHRTCPGYP